MVHSDIRRAKGIPASVYSAAESFVLQRERVFARSWQWIGDTAALENPGDVRPVVVLPGCLDEPLVLLRDEHAELRALSNVCTHRGNLVVQREERHCTGLRCRYHGRRFALDGRCASMPDFQDVDDFPAAADDLTRIALGEWGRFSFVRLEGDEPLWESIRSELGDWLSFVDHAALVLDSSRSRDYQVAAHWALYCENYLEGFHIPFVHPNLAGALDWRDYRTELLEHCVVQIGVAKGDGPTLGLPSSHPALAGGARDIAALYVFVYPNLMLNAYPWGLSINVVEPLECDRSRIRFVTYVSDASKLGGGAGGDVHQVELEDEAVVESVQRGTRSRFFRRARFSPTQERGVHWLHRRLAATLDPSPAREPTAR